MRITPSDRVDLIAEIAKRLGKEEWKVLDLTLRQFKLPWTNQWENSDRSAYVMEMISEAGDDALISLASHVGFDFELSPRPNKPTFWEPGYFRLFVSHLAEYRKVASDIKRRLFTYGISAFVAHNDIEPTQEWQDEIELGLRTCQGMLALLHPQFHQSKWTDQEIGYAMGRELLVVPVRNGTDPYGFIGRFQAMEGAGKTPADLVEELFVILCRHPKTSVSISEAVVEVFRNSESFACAKRNMDLLETLRYWNSTLTTRARAALEANSQLRREWNVPSRLESFIHRMEKGIGTD